jgi:hypothetical protein
MAEPENTPPVIAGDQPQRRGVSGRIGLSFSLASLTAFGVMLVFKPG